MKFTLKKLALLCCVLFATIFMTGCFNRMDCNIWNGRRHCTTKVDAILGGYEEGNKTNGETITVISEEFDDLQKCAKRAQEEASKTGIDYICTRSCEGDESNDNSYNVRVAIEGEDEYKFNGSCNGERLYFEPIPEGGEPECNL